MRRRKQDVAWTEFAGAMADEMFKEELRLVQKCPRCPHKLHQSRCGEPTEIQHVEIECACVMPNQESLDKKELRRRDADQEKRIELLKNSLKRR